MGGRWGGGGAKSELRTMYRVHEIDGTSFACVTRAFILVTVSILKFNATSLDSLVVPLHLLNTGGPKLLF